MVYTAWGLSKKIAPMPASADNKLYASRGYVAIVDDKAKSSHLDCLVPSRDCESSCPWRRMLLGIGQGWRGAENHSCPSSSLGRSSRAGTRDFSSCRRAAQFVSSSQRTSAMVRPDVRVSAELRYRRGSPSNCQPCCTSSSITSRTVLPPNTGWWTRESGLAE